MPTAQLLQCFGEAIHAIWVQLVLLNFRYEAGITEIEHPVYLIRHQLGPIGQIEVILVD